MMQMVRLFYSLNKAIEGDKMQKISSKELEKLATWSICFSKLDLTSSLKPHCGRSAAQTREDHPRNDSHRNFASCLQYLRKFDRHLKVRLHQNRA